VPDERYLLGRNCTLSVDGKILSGIRDVAVRQRTREFDLTGFMHNSETSVVTHRTLDLEIEVLKPADAAVLRAAEKHGDVVTITTTNGLREFTRDFVVCESSADEPLDDAVRARFTLKQWSHSKE
jgi:hypothetical protein